jgi:signal transduction histidine kinase
MAPGRVSSSEADRYRRKEWITTLARGLSCALGVGALVLLWNSPQTRSLPAALTGVAWITFFFLARFLGRRFPERSHQIKVLHDVVDALAVGAGSCFSGGLHSPIWLLLYAHVVAVSVRGGLRYAMAMGTLDAAIVLVLAAMTSDHPEGPLHAVALLFCAFMGGTTSSHLHEIQHRLLDTNRELQGKNVELLDTAARARDMEGEARAHLARAREANERLEQLDRLRNQYLRNVSHEFRTPLTVIRGYGEHLLNEGSPPDGSISDAMRVIVENCDQIIDMVDTLIEVSRIEEEGARSLSLRSVDLGDVAAASVDPLRLRAAKKGIELETEFPPEPVRVHGDPSLLDHLVRKLVDNALKYSDPGGRVVVRGGQEGPFGTLEVQDTGVGIAPEHIPRIFDKFYMVDGSLTRRRRGAGVGLYLAREIVRLHHGTIEVESRPGEGSVFHVRLPGPLVAGPIPDARV